MAVWFEEFVYIDGKIIPLHQLWIMNIFILLFHKVLFFYVHFLKLGYGLNWGCEKQTYLADLFSNFFICVSLAGCHGDRREL